MKEENYKIAAEKLLEECQAIRQPIDDLRFINSTHRRIYFEADIEIVGCGARTTVTLFVRKKSCTAEIVNHDTLEVITDKVFERFENIKNEWEERFG